MTSPKNATTTRGKRFYSWRNENYWSVTTIIGGGIPKPVLVPWAIKMVAEGAVDAAERGVLTGLIESDREGAIRFLKGLPYAKRDAAGDLGTLVHNAVEAYSLGKPYPTWPLPVVPYMKAFEAFLADFSPFFTATEASVYNRTQRYAGTLDGIATLTLPLHAEPMLALFDVKTGKNVYSEVALQLAAYRFAEFIGLPDGSEAEMPKTDGALCLHLAPEGYRLIEVRADEDVFQAFLFAREVFRWQEETSKTVLGLEYGPPPKSPNWQPTDSAQGNPSHAQVTALLGENE